jgi:hypothetical protein
MADDEAKKNLDSSIWRVAGRNIPGSLFDRGRRHQRGTDRDPEIRDTGFYRYLCDGGNQAKYGNNAR